MTEQFSNFATTTLNGGIDNAVTSIVVTSATPFPSSSQYRITIDTEIMIVTAGAGTTTWTVTRGAESTAAASHSNGAAVSHTLTAGGLGTFASLASPTFTGTPSLPAGTTATTQSANDNSTKPATTAYVDTADALKANIASPTFTGTPVLPNTDVTSVAYSNCETIGGRAAAVALMASFGTGLCFGTRAVCRVAATYTKIVIYIDVAGTSVTHLVGGVWDSSGALLGSSSDWVSFLTAADFQVMTGLNLALTAGQQVFVGFGVTHGSAAPQVRGTSIASTALNFFQKGTVAMEGAINNWNGSTALPSLSFAGTIGSTQRPWAALVP